MAAYTAGLEYQVGEDRVPTYFEFESRMLEALQTELKIARSYKNRCPLFNILNNES